MPNASMRFETTIHADPETIFAYISDLSRHGEWAGNSLSITPVEADQPIAVGQCYHSQADVGSLHFEAELTITKLDPPHQFAFRGSDSTGKFHHTFTITPKTEHSIVQRQFDFTLTFVQWMMFYVLYFPVRRPAALKALARLKTELEDKDLD